MKKVLCTAALMVAALGSADTAVARPCGQQSECPSITLEGPLPSPYPANDPKANANFPSVSAVSTLGGNYIEEEYFVSGTANVFNYSQVDAPRGENPGDNLVVRDADVPYVTRIIVKRPVVAQRFNGTVIMEAMNSTAGFETQPAWVSSADYFVSHGIVFIEVTTSGNQGLPYLQRGCGLLQPSCGSRYESLSIPDNGQEYEIISQLATALKSGDSAQVPLPRDFGPVQRVFFTGQSQQGGSVITHANEFYFDGVDGYFIQSASRARAISGNRAAEEYCGEEGADPYPDCVAGPAPGADLPRTDLPVPVYQGMTETDAALLGGISRRLPDTDTSPYGSFRLVEIPGTSHVAVANTEILPGLPLRDLCRYEVYTFVDGPVYGYQVFDAMWENMRLQVDRGILPPHAPRIATDAEGNVLRDQYENALGGLRLPEFQYPAYSFFSPTNSARTFCAEESVDGCLDLPLGLKSIANLACRLIGSAEPLPPEVIAELYPVRGRHARDASLLTLELAKHRFLLPEDARQRLIDAARVR